MDEAPHQEPQFQPQRSITLPNDLHAAITRALATVPAARWTRAAQALSVYYRAARTEQERSPAIDRLHVLGYAALILPATYAQLHGALNATAARIPHWAPTTMLDLGSGPGTALWAATERWPTLRTLTAWERAPAFIALGRELARDSACAAVRGARWEQRDLRQIDRAAVPPYDLVVLGHVLNELAPAVQQQVIARAWELTGGLLLIVEPGTSALFAVVRAAREQLLALGAHTIAPCAHDQPCPLVDDWCHFPQRLIRPDFQRRARGAPSQWEDSKFAYAALARFAPEQPIWGRVIRETTSNKAYAEATLSTRAGIVRYQGLKRHREVFRRIQRLAWGAALDAPLPEDIKREA
jgi:ribosomal protein RSM22 (predicted rRNA methylase)